MKTTDELVDDLYETSMDTPGIGDRIVYARGGANPRTINAFVSHRDKTEALAGTQLTAQDIMVEVLKRDVPVPSYADTITLPRLNFKVSPKDWHNDDAGKSWVIYVKLARV